MNRLSFKPNRNSILYKVFLPMIFVMMAQSTLFMMVITQGGVVGRLNQNAFEIFDERVSNRARELEMEMTQKWAQLDAPVSEVSAVYQTFLSQRNLTTEAFSADEASMKEFLGEVSSCLVFLLRQNKVNGVFLILNGTDGATVPSPQSPQTKLGICIRDFDQNSGYQDNTDLLLERAPVSVAKKLGYAFDSWWESTYTFTADQDNSYYYKPLLAAYMYPNYGHQDLAYWCAPHCIAKTDPEVLSYSVPLFDANGRPYGVLGIELTAAYLSSLLPSVELGGSNAGTYVLAGSLSDAAEYQTYIYEGFAYQKLFGNAETFRLLPKRVSKNCFQIDHTSKGTVAYSSLHTLHLYNSNTPFEREQISVLGIMEEKMLLSFNGNVRNSLFVTTVISLILGILGILFVSRHFASPIIQLSQKVRQSTPQEGLSLDKIGILEIDQLTASIEELSVSVSENAARLSTIIRMTGIPIGAFEADFKSGKVFFTEEFFSVMGIFTPEEQVLMQDTVVFQQKINALHSYLAVTEEPDASYIYHLNPNSDREKWVRFRQVEHNQMLLGIVIDCTAELQEKLKISHERDHDILTDLYNRRAFHVALHELFQTPDELGVAAMLMMDIDNLKYVNDTYGHDYGDAYIKRTADALRSFQGPHMLLARMSGDEFMIFLHHRNNKEELRSVLSEIKEQLAGTYLVLPQEPQFHIRVSGGIAFYPFDTTDPLKLIKYADFAMYGVKKSIKGEFFEFNLRAYKRQSLTAKQEQMK